MIKNIDHIVLTVSNIENSVNFYKEILNMQHKIFGNNRNAMHFGNQKINLQLLGQEDRNNAKVGSGDICLITEWKLQDVINFLNTKNVKIIEGPVTKSGANGKIESVYILDPDNNLIEISTYN